MTFCTKKSNLLPLRFCLFIQFTLFHRSKEPQEQALVSLFIVPQHPAAGAASQAAPLPLGHISMGHRPGALWVSVSWERLAPYRPDSYWDQGKALDLSA